MEDLTKFFDGFQVSELTRKQCLAMDDLNGFATFNLISPGDLISYTFSGKRFEGTVAGKIGDIRLEFKTPQGSIISSSQSPREILAKVSLFPLLLLEFKANRSLLLLDCQGNENV